MFDQEILLRIRRNFTESESINFVSKRLSETEIELGIVKSELGELKHSYDNIKSENKSLKIYINQLTNEERHDVSGKEPINYKKHYRELWKRYKSMYTMMLQFDLISPIDFYNIKEIQDEKPD